MAAGGAPGPGPRAAVGVAVVQKKEEEKHVRKENSLSSVEQGNIDMISPPALARLASAVDAATA